MMKKLACLSAALALFAGCGMLGLGGGGDDEDKPAAKPEAKPEDERSKKQDEAKPAASAPAPEAKKPADEKPYEPPDFPAPWTDSPQAFQGDFWNGKELLGVDPYRSPDATGGQRGYYFGFPEVVVEKKVEEKKKK